MKYKNILILFIFATVFAYMIINGEEIKALTISAMTLCFFKIIPSIFPFMVFSNILLRFTNFDTKRGSILRLAAISWVSGFIVGPKFLYEM